MTLQKISKKFRQALVSILTMASVWFGTPKAEAAVPYPNNLYLTQVGAVTCTLVASAMMIRARMYLSNNSNWPNCNEDTLYPIAWAPGLYNSFAWNRDGVYVHVTSTTVSGLTLAQLKNWMAAHPEGVLIHIPVLYYNGQQTSHGQWITDVENDIVYSADTSWSGYFGRRPITNTFMGQTVGSQANILANVRTIWYIDSYNIPANTSYPGVGGKTQKAANVPNGTYRIASYKDIKYGLDVAGGSTADNANVHLWEYTAGTKQQQFDVTFEKDHYSIKATHSGKRLDLNNGNSDPGTSAIQYVTDGTPTQDWVLEDAGDGAYYIVNNNGLYLDIYGGTVANGTNIQGYTGNKSDAQKWFFINVEEKQTIPDGDYQIRSKANFAFGVEVGGGSTENSANVQLWTLGNDANHKWSIKYLGGGYYSIRAKHTGMALNVTGASSKAANVQQHTYTDNDAASMWIIKEAGEGCFYIINKNGLFLDINNGTIANGTNIGGWCGNSSVAQKWRFVAVDGEEVVGSGIYRIRSAKNQAYGLDIDGKSTENEANVHLWQIADSNNDNQKFNVTALGNGYYSIVALHSGKALDVHNADVANGANIQQYTNGAATNDAQQWIIRKATNNSFYIINKKGLFLDIADGTIANGTNIQGWAGNGSTAQQWILDPDKVVPMTGVDLQAKAITLEVGKTGNFTPKILPADATDKRLNWSSDNTSVVTVSNGTITCKAVGTATITATSVADGTIKDYCVVTVIPKTSAPHPSTYSLEKKWSTTDIPAKLDARQATVANGKLYIQDKANSIIHIYDHNGKTSETLTDSGKGTQISSDEAGNIIVRYGEVFPNVWGNTEQFKVYIGGSNTNTKIINAEFALPAERQDYFGKMRGDIINGEGVLPVASSTSAAVHFLTFNDGELSSSIAETSAVSGMNCGIVSHVADDYYVAQNARTLSIRLATYDGNNYNDSYEIATPNRYSSAGIDGVELMHTKYLAYNIGSGYYDGFSIVQINKSDANVTPLTTMNETTTSSTSGYQTNWVLFDKVDEYHAYVYHYFPGGYVTCYYLSAPDKSGIDQNNIVAVNSAVVVGGIGEINVIGETNNVEVYSISGGLVSRGKTQVNVNPGAYIVRVDGKTTKVVVK